MPKQANRKPRDHAFVAALEFRFESAKEFEAGAKAKLMAYSKGRHRRDFKAYAQRGTLRPLPVARRHLKAAARQEFTRTMKFSPAEQQACFKNSQLAFFALHSSGFQYFEGLYYDEANRAAVQHAWLEKDGQIFDPTLLFVQKTYPQPGARYFGVAYPYSLVSHIVLTEEQARPIALGKPRLLEIQMMEDIFFREDWMRAHLQKLTRRKRKPAAK